MSEQYRYTPAAHAAAITVACVISVAELETERYVTLSFILIVNNATFVPTCRRIDSSAEQTRAVGARTVSMVRTSRNVDVWNSRLMPFGRVRTGP